MLKRKQKKKENVNVTKNNTTAKRENLIKEIESYKYIVCIIYKNRIKVSCPILKFSKNLQFFHFNTEF